MPMMKPPSTSTSRALIDPVRSFASGFAVRMSARSPSSGCACMRRSPTGNAVGGPRSMPSIGLHGLKVHTGQTDLNTLNSALNTGLVLKRFSGNSDPVSGNFSGIAKNDNNFSLQLLDNNDRLQLFTSDELAIGEPSNQRDVLEARRVITDLALDLAEKGEIELNPDQEDELVFR